MDIILGVFLHALGGGAAASFYIPFKKVKDWAWKSYWLISGVAAWILMPIILGWLTIPHLFTVIMAASPNTLFWCFVFGVLWGIGGLTFGLSMRYLGMSLGYAIVIGFAAAFGTIIPPIFNGKFLSLFSNLGGSIILSGIIVSLIGIGVCGWAGFRKDKELPQEMKETSITEFDFKKGMLVALTSGILSACMAFGLAAGKPLANIAVKYGADNLWKNNVILVVVLLGGFLTNFIWSMILNIKNNTTKDYITGDSNRLTKNYFYSSLAGAIWYMQFFFYGMGTTQMGKYNFVSWTLHMSFIIILGNLWGIYLREWKGTKKETKYIIGGGLGIIVISVILIGIGANVGS